ncbi:hypothetical protein SAMN06272771_6338 [Streptomyces sp. Ag82_O1-12]|uniref:hypothetical protein n=1 Tax=Streptomyces sp. Ag82_G6-1 TaxID=1938853 RepID=UPI000BD2AA6B|nr:hypothetical protein SAMN06272771_6338 [Streptomyces sp. Ag82_O1-12]SOD48887.1 hypothetical protein SAMN06272727_6342 [Streptomyces sp. Ag82_G6-1]
MPETVPVRCPACRREHRYTAPAYPCVCGAPVAPPLDRDGSATPVSHRVWQDDWVAVRCGSCGRRGEWPRPEVGCACGVVLRVTVVTEQGSAGRAAAGDGSGTAAAQGPETDQDRTAAAQEPKTDQDRTAAAQEPETDQDRTVRGTAVAQGPGNDRSGAAGQKGPPGQEGAADQPDQQGAAHQPDRPDRKRTADRHRTPGTHDTHHGPRDAAAGVAEARSARPPFLSVTIRTARDAVTAAALYLRWLGYRGVRRADQRPPSGIGLAARGVVAQVDPAVRPASLRDVECLWLTAMTESADCLYFSLAGYADDARARADALGVPLFVLDLTGTPRPVNAPAETLAATGTG